MTLDPREFNGARWWTTDEIGGALGEPFDPTSAASWRSQKVSYRPIPVDDPKPPECRIGLPELGFDSSWPIWDGDAPGTG
jgi:hypothetical protein